MARLGGLPGEPADGILQPCMQAEQKGTQNAPQADPGVGGKSYYLSQLCGWGLYGVVLYLVSRTHGAREALDVAVYCATGLLGTHVLSAYANRRRWHSSRQLLLPFAVAALLIPAAMNAATFVIPVLVFGKRAEGTPAWLVMAHYFQAVLVVSVWCAVFLSANEARRRRVAEMEALRLALVAQVSQFRALRSQLNPHFLFNCLNSLRELIEEDSGRAVQVVDRLSELLRYTLRTDRVETVALREELRAVEDYLSLEKVRFEERLRVRFSVDAASLEAKLPPMLLQTLVENGVKHGIAQLPAGGDLAIAAQLVNGKLRIEVTSSGVLSAAEGSSAVGLENARERLRLMYREGASLSVAALDECNVRAVVVIPVNSNGVGG